MVRITRHSLYYRLMDICFGIQVASVALQIGEIAADTDFVFGPIGSIVMAFHLISLILPVFLIFARFMRDDFAEQLWQKTAGTVLKALTFLPPIAAIVVGMLIGTGSIEIPEVLFNDSDITETQGGAILGVVMSLIYMWVYTPMVFTFAFQWHRWRASR